MGYLMTHVHVNVKLLLTYFSQYVGIQSRIIQFLTMAQVVIHTPYSDKTLSATAALEYLHVTNPCLLLNKGIPSGNLT